MNLGDGKLKFETDYKKVYSKSISSYCKNNLVYSDEPYEFRIEGGTPNGKIIVPGKLIHIPYNAKKVVIEDESVAVKDSKIISIDEIEKDNNKFIEAEISNIVSFNLRLYDEYYNIYKIICYFDKYPTPDKQSFTKDFITVYSIVITKILINSTTSIIYNSCYDKPINLKSKATVKDIKYRLFKQRKDTSLYEVKYEDYINLLVGIEIHNQMEIFCDAY